MNIDRKTVIWHPDDAYRLIGKKVVAFDDFFDKFEEGKFVKFSADIYCPFEVEYTDGSIHKHVFIAPVPEPKYRPFANAEEFAPYREKWLRTKNVGELWRVYSYNNNGIITPSLNFVDYEKMLGTYDFEDGSPCGKEYV